MKESERVYELFCTLITAVDVNSYNTSTKWLHTFGKNRKRLEKSIDFVGDREKRRIPRFPYYFD